MRFGYWMPIFGGWLRNVTDEDMPVSWSYIRDLAAESGFASAGFIEIGGPLRVGRQVDGGGKNGLGTVGAYDHGCPSWRSPIDKRRFRVVRLTPR